MCALEVVGGGLTPLRVISEVTDREVAVLAKQATNPPRLVAVVDVQALWT